jgi:cysteine sulfinate desulfinase/cysteine desulfurase-like protein
MQLSPEVMDGSFRVSLSRDTTEADIQALIAGVEAILAWKRR